MLHKLCKLFAPVCILIWKVSYCLADSFIIAFYKITLCCISRTIPNILYLICCGKFLKHLPANWSPLSRLMKWGTPLTWKLCSLRIWGRVYMLNQSATTRSCFKIIAASEMVPWFEKKFELTSLPPWYLYEQYLIFFELDKCYKF